MNYNDCAMCGKRLDEDRRYHAEFCGDKCRTQFHNAMRRVERTFSRAFAAIDTLVELSQVSPDIGDQALKRMEDLRKRISKVQENVTHYCEDCGQSRYLEPYRGDKCSFCGGENWKRLGSLNTD